jgi:ligand-binding SRPBCC domain-containing protein
MPVHTLECTQVIHAGLNEAWDFFSDPRNLQRITPPSLGFEIRTALPRRVFPGMMIEYRVRPLAGIPMTWVTEITHVAERQFFVDEQRIGPYRLWHHEHHFRDLGDGRVEMRDRVTYALPFGWLAEPLHLLFVRPQVRRIFDIRVEAVERLFSPAAQLAAA